MEKAVMEAILVALVVVVGSTILLIYMSSQSETPLTATYEGRYCRAIDLTVIHTTYWNSSASGLVIPLYNPSTDRLPVQAVLVNGSEADYYIQPVGGGNREEAIPPNRYSLLVIPLPQKPDKAFIEIRLCGGRIIDTQYPYEAV